jgi:hypothetical protein
MSGTTSPGSTFSAAPLTDDERTWIRHFCGYPPAGTDANDYSSWRFFQTWGLLEYRMQTLAPTEIQKVRYYLSLLYVLDPQISSMSGTIGVATAGPFERNANEMGERRRQIRDYAKRLLRSIGVPPGPLFEDGGGQIVV